MALNRSLLAIPALSVLFFFFSSRRRHTRSFGDWEFRRVLFRSFHVYGCEWDEREIRWYIDGRLIQARSNDFWHQALDVVVSFGVRADLKVQASREGFPTSFRRSEEH